MIKVFVSNHCTRIYIPTNVYTNICLEFIYKIELAIDKVYVSTNQENIGCPRTLTSKNDYGSTVY